VKQASPKQKRQPWAKFYFRDWRADPALRMCSYAARGLWADLLSLMHEAHPRGYLLVDNVIPTAKQLAGLLGGSEREVRALLDELASNHIFSVTGEDVPNDVLAFVPANMPAGVLLSRRMVRDEAKALKDRENGRTGGNPQVKGAGCGSAGNGDRGVNPSGQEQAQGVGKGVNGGVNPPANPQKAEDRGKAPTGPSPSPIETPSPDAARAGTTPQRSGDRIAAELVDLAEKRRRQQMAGG
jgi:hypothetical protein